MFSEIAKICASVLTQVAYVTSSAFLTEYSSIRYTVIRLDGLVAVRALDLRIGRRAWIGCKLQVGGVDGTGAQHAPW